MDFRVSSVEFTAEYAKDMSRGMADLLAGCAYAWHFADSHLVRKSTARARQSTTMQMDMITIKTVRNL
jgi:hypothetical protein